MTLVNFGNSLVVLDKLDVMDTEKTWRVAIVKNIEEHGVLIHYHGWDSKVCVLFVSFDCVCFCVSVCVCFQSYAYHTGS